MITILGTLMLLFDHRSDYNSAALSGDVYPTRTVKSCQLSCDNASDRSHAMCEFEVFQPIVVTSLLFI